MKPEHRSGAVLPMVPKPYETLWQIRGERFVARFWTSVQWARMRDEDRPDEAQRVGDLGWLVIELAPN